MPSGTKYRPSRADIRRRQRLMRRMMRIAGIKPQDAAGVDGGLAILEARTKCGFCQHEDQCQAWLNTGGELKDLSQIQAFCSNARLLRALRETMGKRPGPEGADGA